MTHKAVTRIGAWMILLAIVWGVWWLLGSYWSPILFWGYLAVGVLLFVVGFRTSMVALWRKDPSDPLGIKQQLLRAQLGHSSFQMFRLYTVLVLGNLAAALAWPATLVAGGVLLVKHGLGDKKVGSREYTATVSLHTPLALLCGVTAAMVLVLVVASLAMSSLPGPYRQITLLLLAVSVVIRHFGFLIDFQSLPTQLRRQVGNPLVSFVLVGLTDLVTLVFTFAAFTAWSSDQQVGFANIRDAGTNTLLLAKVWPAVASGGDMSWLELLSSIAGALFILNGFKSLAKYQDFLTPTTDDVHVVARNQIALGEFREARKLLDAIAPHKREPITLELYACVHLALDNLEQAHDAARNCAEQMKLDAGLREAEAIRILVIDSLSLPIERERMVRYLKHWVETVPHDLHLSIGIEGYAQKELLAIRARSRSEAEHQELRRAFFYELEPIFADEEARKRHAASCAALFLIFDLHAPAEELLREFRPAVPAEEILRVCLLYLAIIRGAVYAHPLDPIAPIRETLRELEAKHAADLVAKAKTLKTDDERLTLIDRLHIVADQAGILECPHTEHLIQLAKQLTDDLGGIPRIGQMLKTSIGVRPQRQQALRDELQALRAIAAAHAATAPPDPTP